MIAIVKIRDHHGSRHPPNSDLIDQFQRQPRPSLERDRGGDMCPAAPLLIVGPRPEQVELRMDRPVQWSAGSERSGDVRGAHDHLESGDLSERPPVLAGSPNPAQRLLAEPDGLDPADPPPLRAREKASPVPERADRLARQHCRWRECRPHFMRLARQAVGPPPTPSLAAPGWLIGRPVHSQLAAA
jgi:hypothetical protein